jgi:uncharacterized protein YwqG
MKDETEVYRPAADLMALKATIDANEYLVKHSEDVLKLAEPVVSMTLTDGMGQAQSSRLGGQPFVPREFEWPQHPVGIYKFLGQINFSEIENRPEALPATGLLVLFFAYDDEGEVFWQDEGYVIANYFENYDDFDLAGKPGPSQKIEFNAGFALPQQQELLPDSLLGDGARDNLVNCLDHPVNYLLNYPSFNSLCYDPTPDKNWMSLLNLTSVTALNWCWHDGDRLMIFIEKDRLKNQDFSQLRADAG